MRKFTAACLAGLAIGAYAPADANGQLSNLVVVIDGDTIVINGLHIRLWGMDAPEMKQECADGWRVGPIAKRELASIISHNLPSCYKITTDRYGRTVAQCFIDGEDIGQLMVQQGWAWAYTKYSRKYVQDEADAKLRKLGIHGHDCMPAWEWRHQHDNSRR
jgi:endonuclease YncB( thermonuclease family)